MATIGEAVAERPIAPLSWSNRLRGVSSTAIVTPALDHHLNAAAAPAASNAADFPSSREFKVAPLLASRPLAPPPLTNLSMLGAGMPGAVRSSIRMRVDESLASNELVVFF
ncbi:MAG TPA: hypothetical protein VMA86_06280 [Acetobacteraceae bacterium]|nr:hypothetical protein [Acetobacteraceae bacterium]